MAVEGIGRFYAVSCGVGWGHFHGGLAGPRNCVRLWRECGFTFGGSGAGRAKVRRQFTEYHSA